MAFITFITPTIGRLTLDRTLLSLVAQTDKDWESYVVGDCITDPFFTIGVKDPRISYWNLPEKKGPVNGKDLHQAGEVRNQVLRKVKSEWIGFVDDDDTLMPQYVEWLKEAKDADVVIFKMTNEDHSFIRPDTEELKVGTVGISFAVKTSFVQRHNMKFENSCSEDWGFIKRCQDHKAKISISEHIAYLIRHAMPSKKIVLMYPSRGRAEQAKKVVTWYIEHSSGYHDLYVHMSLDEDDKELPKYHELLMPMVDKIYVNANKGIVQAVNRLYDKDMLSRQDIILIISDDMLCPTDWDLKLVDLFDRHGYDKLLKTVNQFNGDLGLVVLPIAGAKFFIDYGSFYYPWYYSLFCDNDLTEWAIANNRLVRTNLLFPHMHPHVAGSVPDFVKEKYGETLPLDETYIQENSSYAWDIGQKLFLKRKESNFMES